MMIMDFLKKWKNDLLCYSINNCDSNDLLSVSNIDPSVASILP
jgi:hypothetical protein